MKRLLLAIALGLSTPSLAVAQASVVGDWEGVLKAGAVELRLALHVVKDDNSGLKATLDNIDQGGFHIPVTSIVLAGQKLTLRIDALTASYEGTVSADATAIDGTWSQRATVPLVLARAPKRADVTPSDIDGVWTGTLDAGASKLRPLFHITNSPYGLVATMDVPDQGVRRLVTTASRNGSSLKLHVRQVNGTFEGKIDEAHTTIDGTWSQSGVSLPLVLTLVKDAAALEPRRPQNPVKPYPYRDEDVTYENTAAHITLAATLTIPPGPGPFPAVLLITGSGAQDRDESLMGHHPFLVLADYLTRHGIAVLRADDRGVGKSGGTFVGGTTADFATDAEAGVAFLRTRRDVDGKKIGLVGHSEGGMIAPMVAARDRGIAFIVMMAGPGVDGGDLLVAQSALVVEAMGASHEQAEASGALTRALTDIVKQEPDGAAREKKLRDLLAGKAPPAQIDAQVEQLNTPWFRYLLSYDPTAALRRVMCPVLAINGERDLQVPPKQNLPAIRSALEASGNKHFEIVELPGLNHLFQTAKTGSPSEYAQIEETMSPVALDMIARWILKQ